MSSLNKVMLLGRLGKDPEIKHTEGGKTICKFSIATDETWKGSDGEKQSKTTWHNIVVWGKLAEICGQYLSKGKLVFLEGKIQVREWEDKEGAKRVTTEILVSNMVMCGGREDGEGKPAVKPGGARHGDDSNEDEDVPF